MTICMSLLLSCTNLSMFIVSSWPSVYPCVSHFPDYLYHQQARLTCYSFFILTISLSFLYLLLLLSLFMHNILLFCPVSSASSLHVVQSDLNTISSWLSSQLLTINSSKSKYMIITRKPSSFSSLPKLTLNGTQVDLVSS